MTLHIVRDLLDVQLRDCRYRPIGRVDGLRMESGGGRPPRVVAIEMGPVVLASRIHGRIGDWVASLMRRLHLKADPVVIPMRQVGSVDLTVTLTVDATSNPDLLRSEKWLAGRRSRLDDVPAHPKASKIPEAIIRVQDLVGSAVRARNGRIVGHIEELRAEPRKDGPAVTEFLLGSGALRERWALMRHLIARTRTIVVRWDQIDISDPERVRLTCSVGELKIEDS